MADVKISGLPAATTPLAGTEVLPIVQSTTTKKVSIADVTAGRAVSASSLTATNLKTSPATANLDISGTTIAASGSDANVDVNINAKGSGVAYLNQRWGVNQSGALVASSGNTYDIGNGTNNPRDVNIDRYAVMNALTASKGVFTDASKNLSSTGILGSDQGGTGNGFTKFSGPTTSEKTFTLPNSSETLLYSGGPLGTPASGTLTNCTFPTLNQNTTGSANSVKSNANTGLMQIAGPSAGQTRVVTIPDANATMARTDAAQSFTGDQTLSTGNLVIGTSGKGIDFSATPGTGTSELFADYEEGTWTPTTSASVTPPTTPTTGTGYYTKVGRQVTVTCGLLDGFSMAGSSGSLQITGLPFTSANSSGNSAMGNCIFYKIDTPAGTVNLAPYVASNSAVISFFATVDNDAYQIVTDNATTDGRCWFTVTYFV